MRTKFRPLSNDDGVEVGNAQAVLGQQSAHAPQKLETVGVLPFRIGIGEMAADIPQSRGSEKRVTDSVRQNISIGVADGAFFERHFDASEDQPTAGGESMQIIPDTRTAHRPVPAAARS